MNDDSDDDPRRAALQQAFRAAIPAASDAALDALAAQALQLAAQGLSLADAAQQVLGGPLADNIRRRFPGSIPPAPDQPAAPPEGLNRAQEMEWARGNFRPTRAAAPVRATELPPENLTGAERMAWARARDAEARKAAS